MMRQVIKVEIEQLALLERGSIGTLFTKIDLTMFPNALDAIRKKSVSRPALLQPFFATQPLEIIHLDHLTLEPCKGQYKSVSVVTDHFTRYVQAYAIKNQTALTTAKVLWEQFLRHYGFPQKILTDQGPGF